MKAKNHAKVSANWVTNELFGRLKKENLGLSESPITSEQLGKIIDLITNGDISGKIAKDLFEILWNEGGDAIQIVNERNMKQVTDTEAIQAAVDTVIDSNPEQLSNVTKNPKLVGWFVGQVMKITQGKANPKVVNELIKKKLNL